MKTLYLIRHAKSSWAFDFSDHDRPLGPRGRKDVRKMSQFAQKNFPAPSVIVTSTASRALYTALCFADEWGYSEEKIITDERLFHASSETLLSILNEYEKEESLAVFGHNPGLTDFNNLICKDEITNISTCGVVGIRFDVKSWSEIIPKSGKQLFFHKPKRVSA